MTITIGIDPHKATHTAVAVDTKEAVVGEHKVRASATQATALIDGAQGFGSRTWAVESAAGLGYLLAQQLVAAGETVVDVPPVLAARVRIMGSGRSQKNDPNDARSVAIAALRSNRLARVRPLTTLECSACWAKRHRDMARLRNTHCSRLHALLGCCPPRSMSTAASPISRRRRRREEARQAWSGSESR